MWSGEGVSDPLSVIEQITYLLFVKWMDELHLAKEAQPKALDTPIEDPIFEPGQDHLRWLCFKDFEPEREFNVFKDKIFPYIKFLNGSAGSAYTKFIKDAVLSFPTK